ncbi:RHS repeat-associated core domain-containing protein [Lusitaniella coriacea LEGE 07157]|uniref:RHS repeat-associated core domain-containing protein n=1 Tax=Lusitaniella coriacea LEGE 07157 TaxID=945747 RepID=A0A8J7IXR4_9CYAN|nr:RHS repeat-associated core domain-containing protein [Lusitaniella coriacea]MBE9118937.1 RHS repeat-associated core domain-containing protein [Lusitaniella coriacea LEGE 07157]
MVIANCFDGMGSVIGLADGAGSQVTGFEYDSFGNLRTPEGLPAEVGGDFRFQGQWLESNTDFYHMRARYYDPEVGRFVSRDPVDLIETEPESSNPYQFVYNNPLIYSDPTGMFTITELSAAQNIQDQLGSIKSLLGAELKDYLRERIQEVTSDLLLRSLMPFVPQLSGFKEVKSTFGKNNNTFKAGNVFEDLITKNICKVFGEAGSEILNHIYLEAGVKINGDPSANGFGCNQLDLVDFIRKAGWATDPRPDYIISPVKPKENVSTKEKGWLIGDFKIAVRSIISEYSADPDQWLAMTRYAKKHQTLPIVSFTTFYSGNRAMHERIARAALKQGVIVVILSAVKKQGFR